MGRVLAVTVVIDQVCHGTLSAEAAQSALEEAGRLPPASTPRFTLFAAIGAASLGIIFGTLDATSLLLIGAVPPSAHSSGACCPASAIIR
jgi:hypothetical protein